MSWERARRPEQKEERRLAILDAAARLFDESGLEGTSLSAIARASGVSKANIYRYFESREDILLKLLLDEQSSWTADLADRLCALGPHPSVNAIASAIAASLAAHPRSCGLLSSLATVLEHNVSVESVAAFKRDLHEGIEHTLGVLGRLLPELGPEALHELLMGVILFATGAWPHANPSPVVEQVYARGLVEGSPLDFAAAVERHAALVLRGLVGSRSSGAT